MVSKLYYQLGIMQWAKTIKIFLPIWPEEMYPEIDAEIHGFKILNFACYFWTTNLKNCKDFKTKNQFGNF